MKLKENCNCSDLIQIIVFVVFEAEVLILELAVYFICIPQRTIVNETLVSVGSPE
jgi:hypothetical protein